MDNETITTEEQESAPSEQEQAQPTMMRVIETPMEDEELLAVATELTDLLTIIEELEAEKKAKVASYNANIGEKQKSAHELSNKFKSGVNTDERECPVEYKWDAGIRLIKHPDSGEVLQEDPISEAERQRHMPGFENQVETGEEPEGELMPCASTECDDVLGGNCTRPDGSIECHGYEAPEVEAE
jgi:hypothetical protein